MSRVNYDQFAFNSQKEKLNILAEILEISKSGCCRCGSIYNRPSSLQELLSEVTNLMFSSEKTESKTLALKLLVDESDQEEKKLRCKHIFNYYLIQFKMGDNS